MMVHDGEGTSEGVDGEDVEKEKDPTTPKGSGNVVRPFPRPPEGDATNPFGGRELDVMKAPEIAPKGLVVGLKWAVKGRTTWSLRWSP
jgi:hypothetical protein